MLLVSDNETRNSTALTKHISDESCVAAFGTVGILGLLLNTVTILILQFGKSFGKAIHIQLMNIAIADLLSAVLTPTFIALWECTDTSYPQSTALCKSHWQLISTIIYGSMMAKAWIAIERFAAVYFPLKMLSYRKKHIIIAIIATWIVSFILHLDAAILSGVIKSSDLDGWLCTRITNISDDELLPFFIPLEATRFLLPVLSITGMYLLICLKLGRKGRRRGTNLDMQRQVSHKVIVPK